MQTIPPPAPGAVVAALPVSPYTVGISREFMAKSAAELARDIVAGLDHASSLAAAYGLTAAQWEVLKVWPAFRKQLETAVTELSGPMGMAERIKRKALMALDQYGIVDAATIAGDPKVGAATRLDAIGTLMAAGGIGAKSQQPGGSAGAGPLFVINLPGATQIAVGAPERPVIEVSKND